MRTLISFLLFLPIYLFLGHSFAQNTVGLQKINTELSFPGYNLIYPHNQPNVYLLDNCGEIVHIWEDSIDFRPGNVAELLENGLLVKTKRLNSSPVTDSIWAGGGGAIVEIRDWDNTLVKSFELNNEEFRLHHDFAVMPNGHILMIAWAKKSYEEAITAGRAAELLPMNKIWPEIILEWDPESDKIVWQWEVWDHLIQDKFSNRANFGVVADHPELIDINYDESDGHPDWLHANAIDYNPVLDQIVLSVPHFNEFWIIDHSTTTEEAAGHVGGKNGKGGDLLHRWGNPAAYQQGSIADKKLFFQHDVHWVAPHTPIGSKDFGRITCFNNRVGMDVSSLVIVNTAVNPENFTYTLEGKVFAPKDFETVITYPNTEEIRAASVSLSSVQWLPNGNVLALSGRWGFAYELTPDNEIVWQYIIPLRGGMPVNQGDTLAIVDNISFQLTRYPIDFAGFAGRTISPMGYLELNPNVDFCSQTVTSAVDLELENFKIYPNPSTEVLQIDKGSSAITKGTIYDLLGRVVKSISLKEVVTRVDVQDLPNGIYLLSVENGVVEKFVVKRL